ncbi:hypothetical protein [uncultured Castellaniella sp.]|uniref:anti-sigma factor family protein n=1 Tax=uncultured Castellaniella sp. TaxID=647907 RepID=UPI00262ECD85|nr:hypothetical protein [uncultured Castellaniella sp.]
MPCPRTLLLSACLDPECAGPRRSLILAHVRSCPICAAELDALRCLSDDLRALPDPEGAPEAFRAWRMRPDAGRRDPSRRRSWRQGAFWWMRLPAGLAVAASLAAGVGLANWSLPAAGSARSVAAAARLDVFDAVPPGGLCAAGGLCGTPQERT